MSTEPSAEAQHTENLPTSKDHKLHKFIKKTLHKFSPPRGSPTHDGSPEQSIFERSIEAASSRTLLTNPETPLHYTTEDYISPILDSTTEMIRDPNVDLSCVRLNCLADEEDEEEDEDEKSFLGEVSEDDPLSGKAAVSHSNTDNKTFFSEQQRDNCGCGADFSPRSRSRSIISTSLMTCLEGEDCDRKRKGNVSPLARRLSRRNTNKSWEGDEPAVESGAVTAPGSAVPTEIEYYSFADMVNNEDNDRALASKHRKGSCYTISVKDYIGVS